MPSPLALAALAVTALYLILFLAVVWNSLRQARRGWGAQRGSGTDSAGHRSEGPEQVRAGPPVTAKKDRPPD